MTMIRPRVVLPMIALFLAGMATGIAYYPKIMGDTRKPCIDNLYEAKLLIVLQDSFEGPYGEYFLEKDKLRERVYTDRFDRNHYVPPWCYAEENFFRVVMWRRPEH